jgi:hypothetical protein
VGFAATDSKIRHGMQRLMTSRMRLFSAAPSIQWTRRNTTPIAMIEKTGRISSRSCQYESMDRGAGKQRTHLTFASFLHKELKRFG